MKTTTLINRIAYDKLNCGHRFTAIHTGKLGLLTIIGGSGDKQTITTHSRMDRTDATVMAADEWRAFQNRIASQSQH